jgi:hypothetical protein
LIGDHSRGCGLLEKLRGAELGRREVLLDRSMNKGDG